MSVTPTHASDTHTHLSLSLCVSLSYTHHTRTAHTQPHAHLHTHSHTRTHTHTHTHTTQTRTDLTGRSRRALSAPGDAAPVSLRAHLRRVVAAAALRAVRSEPTVRALCRQNNEVQNSEFGTQKGVLKRGTWQLTQRMSNCLSGLFQENSEFGMLEGVRKCGTWHLTQPTPNRPSEECFGRIATL